MTRVIFPPSKIICSINNLDKRFCLSALFLLYLLPLPLNVILITIICESTFKLTNEIFSMHGIAHRPLPSPPSSRSCPPVHLPFLSRSKEEEEGRKGGGRAMVIARRHKLSSRSIGRASLPASRRYCRVSE